MPLTMGMRGRARGRAAILLGIVLAGACRVGRPHAEAPPSSRALDVVHQALDLALDPATRTLEATCRIEWTARRAFEEARLDLVGLEVRAVTDGAGGMLAFRHEDGVLRVFPARPVPAGSSGAFAVRYGGQPRFGLWFSGFREGLATQAFTHGQTEASRGWFPCVDEPSERLTTEIRATIPATWTSIGPGVRVATESLGTQRRDTWRLDVEHPVYVTTLVAGELVVHESQAGEVPLVLACEPRFEPFLDATFAETPDVLAFLTDLAGRPFPYPKYAQSAVDDFPWGGMENASATTLTPQLLSDARGHADQPPFLLIAHEAAHQWFGDLVTCADWSHVWLNEGLATYLTLLYVEHTRGTDEFRARMRDVAEEALAGDLGGARRPIVYTRWEDADDMLDVHAYQGAATRLHLLRGILGDETFVRGLRAYLAANAGRGVVTDDLRRAFEEASGRDLEPFFHQWLERAGTPELAFEWSWSDGELCVTLDQVQEPVAGTPAVFSFPVEVGWLGAEGEQRARLEVDERRERFRVPLAGRPVAVRLDPDGWLPARIGTTRTVGEWSALARRAADVNARREAVHGLARALGSGVRASAIDDEVREVLAGRLFGDASPWVRADAASALAVALGARARDELERAALGDAEPRVVQAALWGLGACGPDAGLASLAEDVFASGVSWQVRGAAAGLLRATDPERAPGWLREHLADPSPHDVLAAQLLRELHATRAAGTVAVLRDFASDESRATPARAVALELLGATTRDTRSTVRFLGAFLERESQLLRRAALGALTRFSDRTARGLLLDYHPRARSPRERRIVADALARPDR
jgi:aminopeptidase N